MNTDIKHKSFDQLDEQEKYDAIIAHYDDAQESWKEIRSTYTEEVRFALLGDQWDPTMSSARKAQGRQVYTKNVLGVGLNYVVNNFKANPCAIKVHPVGQGADANTAQLLDGLIKWIQHRDEATDSYAHAYQTQLAGGLGAWRVLPVANEYTQKTELRIERILDPLMVMVDPNAKHKNFCDAEYMFLVTKISKSQFIAEYGEENLDELSLIPGWGGKDFVQIAEYWRRSVVEEKIMLPLVPGQKPEYKTVKRVNVDQYIINGNKIIYENTSYPGKYIPIVVVTGNEVQVGEQRIFKSFIHDVMNDQRLLNITKSEVMDSILATNKTRWLLEPEMLGTNGELKKMWDYSASNAYPYLLARAKDGRMPTEITPNPISPAYLEGANEALADIKAGIGIKDTSEDLPAGMSGKAIRLSISEKNIQSYGYLANLQSGIKHTGDILLDLIQYYYTEAEILQILGRDGQVQTVPVNQQANQNGKPVYHDLSKAGLYGCQVDIGPSWIDQKAEALESLMSLSKEIPILGQVAPDLIAQNLSVDNADEIAARCRAVMDPKILAASSSSNLSDNDAQQQLQQIQAENNQLKAFMQSTQQLVQNLYKQLEDAQNENNLKLQLEQVRGQNAINLETVRKNLDKRNTDDKIQHEFIADSALLAQDSVQDMHKSEHSASIQPPQVPHQLG